MLSSALKELKPHKSVGCIHLQLLSSLACERESLDTKSSSAVRSVTVKAHQTSKGQPWVSSLMLGVRVGKTALQHMPWYLFLPAVLYFVFWGKRIELLTGVYFVSFAFLQQNPI